MQTDTAYDYLFKVIVIGSDGSGKSSLLLRYTDDQFSESYVATIGVDFRIKLVNICGKNVKTQIWDTAGQERFRTITTSYYRGCHGAVIVYDVTDRSSFKQTEHFLTDLDHYVGKSLPKLLVANKCDLTDKRCVTSDEGRSLAVINNLDYVETSAKTNEGVQDAFGTLLTEMCKKSDTASKDKPQQLSLHWGAPAEKSDSESSDEEIPARQKESVAKIPQSNQAQWTEELSKELQKLTTRMKSIDKLEATVKKMSKRIEDLERKTSRIESEKSDFSKPGTQSKTCRIL